MLYMNCEQLALPYFLIFDALIVYMITTQLNRHQMILGAYVN